MPQARPASPIITGLVSGAFSGLIVLAVIVLVDHFIFSGRESARYGLVPTLIGAGIIGAGVGAVVGAVVVLSGSAPAGIAAGAVIFALLRLIGMGMMGGWTVLAVFMGLIYGALFGWAVASSVTKALQGE